MPERGALAGIAAWKQQRAGRGLAEARGEERRLAQAIDHERFDALGVGQHELSVRRAIRLGEARDDAVVGPEHIDLEVRSLPHHRADGHRPRRVHLPAERREHADAPVPHLIEVALDDDRLVVGCRARGGDLIAEVLEQVLRRELVKVVPFFEEGRRFLRLGFAQRARERADGAAELERAIRRLAFPERHLAGDAGCR